MVYQSITTTVNITSAVQLTDGAAVICAGLIENNDLVRNSLAVGPEEIDAEMTA